MTTRRVRKGTMQDHEAPDWEPLRAVAGDELLDYVMWMYEVRLRDGTRVQYAGEERYRPWRLDRVLWRMAMDVRDVAPDDELQLAALLAAVGHCERREARRAVAG